MKVFTISFFGHRKINNSLVIEETLEKLISEILIKKNYVEFLVGRDGEFDTLVSSIIRKCKKDFGNYNSALVLVLPYITAEYINNIEYFNQYYDEIEVCPYSATEYFKSAHKIRNQNMITRSDLVIFYVKNNFGGAYTAMKYANKLGIKYINLYNPNSFHNI